MFSDTKPVNKNIDISNDVTQFKGYIKFVDEVVQYYQNYEISLNVYNNMVWSTNTYIMNATYQWLNGDIFENITKQYDVFEGNLIKDFLKIYNLAAELEKISIIFDIPHLEIEAKKVRDNILRDVVNTESLYIKQ